ncbi:MAG: hypothetical protein CHACPFDD_03263 [Phycisphaerae bacterium]|nr:hypothetical protein [Phycisphaerae bacterium]
MVLCGGGCQRGAAATAAAPAELRAAERKIPAAHARIRRETARLFALALFGKPADFADEEVFALAPLLAVEAESADAPPPAAPRVHFERGQIRLGSQQRKQLAYTWHFADRDRGAETDGGVRLTLATDGRPTIYELLTPVDGLRVIYVGEAVERAAAAEFGGPLAGRAFAIERGVDECPDVVVARVLTDGPTPMGPWVYLSIEGAVTTALCRCSPSQVGESPAGFWYELRPADPGEARGRPGRDGRGLEHVLRLPRLLP